MKKTHLEKLKDKWKKLFDSATGGFEEGFYLAIDDTCEAILKDLYELRDVNLKKFVMFTFPMVEELIQKGLK